VLKLRSWTIAKDGEILTSGKSGKGKWENESLYLSNFQRWSHKNYTT
jgi:hypothetical protein